MAMLNESDWEWPFGLSDFVRTPDTHARLRRYRMPRVDSRARMGTPGVLRAMRMRRGGRR